MVKLGISRHCITILPLMQTLAKLTRYINQRRRQSQRTCLCVPACTTVQVRIYVIHRLCFQSSGCVPSKFLKWPLFTYLTLLPHTLTHANKQLNHGYKWLFMENREKHHVKAEKKKELHSATSERVEASNIKDKSLLFCSASKSIWIHICPIHTHTLTHAHPWHGAVGLRNICREQGRASLPRHWPLVVEGLRSGTDSGRCFEVGLRPIPAFELCKRPGSWPAVINISPTSIFKGSAKSTEQGAQALYQKSCHALLWGLMSQFKKPLRLNGPPTLC